MLFIRPDPGKAAASASVGIVAAQVLINVGAALGKGLFPSVGPEGVAALRTGISALLLLLLYKPWKTALSRPQVVWLVPYGLALGCMNLLIYWAFERIPIGVAVAIEICGPLGVVLATSRSRQDLFWLGTAVIGILLLVPWAGDGKGLDAVGILFALAAACCWAAYIVMGRRAATAGNGVAVSIGMTAASLVTLPAGVIAAGTNLLQGHVLAIGIVVALVSSTLPYSLEMRSLGQLSTRQFGVITSTAPAIAALVAFTFLGEHLSPLQWLSVGLIIIAGVGSSLSSACPTSRVDV